jgi:central kinetochore subunit Mis15/CHL4
VPDSTRVPSTTKSLLKSLIRLSKPSLIDLTIQWLREENQATCMPYLVSNRNLEEEVDEDYQWSPAETIDELRLIYNRMRYESNINKRYVIDRMLDGDWRRGLSLYQVATIDFQCLTENDKALRWTALKLVPHNADDEADEEPLKKKRKISPAAYPTISPTTFVRNLQQEIAPLVKAHYHLYRMPGPQNLSILRVCVADSPYANPQSSVDSNFFTDPGRIIFIALPDSCPFIYVSVSGAANQSEIKQKARSARMDITSLKRAVLEEIPKALSKSNHRYSLEATRLTARSLSTMLTLRGNTGANAANGVYTIFSRSVIDNSPIDAEGQTFAQKVLQACTGPEPKESSLNMSGLSLQPEKQCQQRTALAEKSSNLSLAGHSESDADMAKLKVAAATRFGMTGLSQAEQPSAQDERDTNGQVLDRLQIRLDEDLYTKDGHVPSSVATHEEIDPFDQTAQIGASTAERHRQGSARMTLTFQGSDVFAGIRTLAEAGLMDLKRMPAWMTGEEAVSGGTVRQGIMVHGMGGGA